MSEGKTPRLRFKDENGTEFGEWKFDTLGNNCEIIKGSAISKDDLADSGQPCILYGELYTRYGYVIEEVISKTERYDPSFTFSKRYDVLIPSSGETALDISTASCLLLDNVILGGDMSIIRSKNLDGIFLSCLLNSKLKYDIARVAQGVSIVHLYPHHLKKLRVSIPEICEQKKIAEFISQLDKKMALQSQKIEGLENLKRGFMQKIFSRELRFKSENGEEFGEWEEKRLGDSCEFVKGSPISKDDLSDSGKPCILYGELYTRYGFVINTVISKTDKTGMEFVTSKKYDVLIPSSGETALDISTASCLVVDDVILGGDMTIIRSKILHGIFLSCLLNIHLKYDIARVAQGASIVHLYPQHLRKLKIPIPDIREQKKIADFLSAFDEKIEIEKQILEKWQAVKKGLLQQMFV